MNEQELMDSIEVGNHYMNKFGEEFEILNVTKSKVDINFIETNYCYSASKTAVIKRTTRDQINKFKLAYEGFMICPKCEIKRKLNEFYRAKKINNISGLSQKCKYCEKEYKIINKEKIKKRRKEYNNREDVIKRRMKYLKTNKEKINKRQKEYNNKNKEAIKKYRENNKEKNKEYQKEYYLKNKKELNEKSSINYFKNHEQNKNINKKRYLKNKAKIIIQNKKYRDSDIRKEKTKKYRSSDEYKKKRAEYNRKWQIENKDFYRIKNKLRTNPELKNEYEKEKKKRATKRKQKQKDKDDRFLLTDSYIKNMLSTKFDIPFADIPADLIELQRALITVQRQKNWRT